MSGRRSRSESKHSFGKEGVKKEEKHEAPKEASLKGSRTLRLPKIKSRPQKEVGQEKSVTVTKSS